MAGSVVSGLACSILSSPWPATFTILSRNNAKTVKTGSQHVNKIADFKKSQLFALNPSAPSIPTNRR